MLCTIYIVLLIFNYIPTFYKLTNILYVHNNFYMFSRVFYNIKITFKIIDNLTKFNLKKNKASKEISMLTLI
jgi:hypothetical protein